MASILSSDLQQRVLSYLVQSPNRDLIFPFLSEKFFDIKRNAQLYKLLLGMWKKHGQIPSYPEVSSRLSMYWKTKKEPSVEVQLDWLSCLEKAYTTPVTNCTVEELAELIARKEFTDYTMLAVEEKPPIEIARDIRYRLDKLTNLLSINVAKDTVLPMLSKKYLEDRKTKFLEEPQQYIPLGWERIDRACGGGMLRGELVIILAPTNGGKTFTLLNLAQNLLLGGFKVLYLNLDTPKEVIEKRLYACITGISMNVETAIDEIHEKVLKWESGKEFHDNDFLYQDLIPNTTPVSSLRGIIANVDERYGSRDVIIIDYGDLIVSDTISKEKRHNLGDAFEGLRGLGRDMGKLIITASQANRDSIGLDKMRTITLKNISEAYSKAFPCSLGIAVNQTETERTFNPPCCRMSIFKNTKGDRDIVIPFIADYAKARFYPDTTGVVQRVADVTTLESRPSSPPQAAYVRYGNDNYQKKPYKPWGSAGIVDYPEPGE